jgi:hypothetical protein
MFPMVKSPYRSTAFWAAIVATIFTGIWSALEFLPIFSHTGVGPTLTRANDVGFSLLLPGFLINGLASNMHDAGSHVYFTVFFAWIIYFGLFYGALRIVRQSRSKGSSRNDSRV